MLAPSGPDKLESEAYPFSIIEQEGVRVVTLGELFSTVVQDVQNRVPAPAISLKFHNTAARIITEMCKLLAAETEINRVALSGGVFQNRLLLKLTATALEKEGFSVLTHHAVPCNDGGISLGQAVIAHFAST